MDDICYRLRRPWTDFYTVEHGKMTGLLEEAANKIERLRVERDDLIGILARAYEIINKQREEIKNLEIDLACEIDGEGY